MEACIRKWRCPRCLQEVDWDYEDLAYTGSPICNKDVCEMELLPLEQEEIE